MSRCSLPSAPRQLAFRRVDTVVYRELDGIDGVALGQQQTLWLVCVCVRVCVRVCVCVSVCLSQQQQQQHKAGH